MNGDPASSHVSSASRRSARARADLRPALLALGGLISLGAAVGIGRFVYTPILPRMTEDLGMTKATAGLLASANFAGYLAGALIAATSVLRGSRRRWLLLGLLGSAVTTGAMAWAVSAPVFAVLRFAGGVASAFALVFASALVLDRLSDARRPELAAVHFGGPGAGIAASAALVAAAAALGGGWRTMWLVAGAVSLAGLGAAARFIPERAETAQGGRPGAVRDTRSFVRFVAAYGLFGFGYVITGTFLVAIVRGSPVVRFLEPLVWIVVGLAALPSVVFWGGVGERIGIERAFALACVAEAAGVAASVLWTAPAGVFVAAVLFGGTIMGITALGLIQGRRLTAGDPRGTLAVLTAAFGIGQIIGPAFAGAVYDATGSFLLPSMAAAAALLFGGLLAIIG